MSADEGGVVQARAEELLAIVAHDLRNPLGNILGITAIMQQLRVAPEDAARRDLCVSTIRSAVDRMRRLVDDLLDLTSLSRGELRIEPARHDARDLVEEAALGLTSAATEKSLRMATATAAEPLPVEVDRERILQALGNVLGNAIKFTPRGGTLTVTVARAGDQVRISVADSGVGIAPAELPSIFDRYWRGKSKGAGAGLGLSIAKALVEAHRGQISATSEVGEGTVVELTLPLADVT